MKQTSFFICLSMAATASFVSLSAESLSAACVASTSTGVLQGGLSIADREGGFIKQASGTRFVSNENGNHLVEGEVLVVSGKTGQVISSDRYEVVVSPGAIALLDQHNGVLRVRNLYDNHKESLLVHVSKKYLPVACGQELVLAPAFDTLRSSVMAEGIPRRHVRLFNLSCGGSVMQSEVWTPSIMKRSEILKGLSRSSDKTEHIAAERMLKMAACLLFSTNQHGKYGFVND